MDKEQDKDTGKTFGVFDIFYQAICLIFALQNRSGGKKLWERAESSSTPLIVSGLTAAALFFLFCFVSSQLVIHMIEK